MSDKIRVSFSESDAYRQCQLKWQLAYGERWRSKEEAPALRRGTALHACHEYHYGVIKRHQGAGVSVDTSVLAKIRASMVEKGLLEVEGADPLVEWMYDGYVDFYKADSAWDVLAVELEFEVPLLNRDGSESEFVLIGRIDLLVRNRGTGKIFVVDHKTCTSLPTEKALDFDEQLALYTIAGRRMGFEVHGAVYNAIRSKKLVRAMTPEERFSRSIVTKTEYELSVVEHELIDTMRDAHRPREVDPPRSPDSDRCNWKPLAGYTPIPTAAGWKCADDVKPGDLLYGRSGMTEVLDTFDRGVQPVYRVCLSDGRYVDATADHPWLVGRVGRGVPTERVVSTADLAGEVASERNHPYASVPLLSAPGWSGPDADLAVDPYALGCWLGDGSRCHYGSAQFTLFVHEDESAHFVEQLGEPHRRYSSPGARCDHLTWRPDQVENAHALRYEAAWHLDRYLFASRLQRLALLQGLMDTDGHGGSGANGMACVSFENTDPIKADLVRRLTLSLGGWASAWTTVLPDRARSRPVCHVKLSLPVGSPPFRMTSKLALWRPTKRRGVRVVDVVPVGEANAVCFEVDAPDSLFAAGDYVLTHNCNFREACLAGRKLGPDRMRQFLADTGFAQGETARPRPGEGLSKAVSGAIPGQLDLIGAIADVESEKGTK